MPTTAPEALRVLVAAYLCLGVLSTLAQPLSAYRPCCAIVHLLPQSSQTVSTACAACLLIVHRQHMPC